MYKVHGQTSRYTRCNEKWECDNTNHTILVQCCTECKEHQCPMCDGFVCTNCGVSVRKHTVA
jgi:hypothetical protein